MQICMELLHHRFVPHDSLTYSEVEFSSSASVDILIHDARLCTQDICAGLLPGCIRQIYGSIIRAYYTVSNSDTAYAMYSHDAYFDAIACERVHAWKYLVYLLVIAQAFSSVLVSAPLKVGPYSQNVE